jgi:hypothetical protein
MGLGFWEERNKNSLLLFFCFFFAWAGVFVRCELVGMACYENVDAQLSLKHGE